MKLTMTRDELLVFLAIAGSKTMNGLEEDPFADLDDREIAERLNSGEQSLINRGLLVIEDDAVTLDDALVALVGSSALPDATLLLTRIEADGSNEVHYFNATLDILVEHASPKPGIFSFTFLPDADALQSRIEMLLAPLRLLRGPDIDDLPAKLSLSADDMARFMEQCKEGDNAAARRTLTQAGWSADAAEQLAHDCATYPSWVGLAAWDLRNGEPKGLDPIMVFQGDNYCWLVENAADNPKQIQLCLASGVECESKLAALAEPLLKTYLST